MSSNLPPGCRESDIPGNRPEDVEFESAMEKAEEILYNAKLTPDELVIAAEGGVAFVLATRKRIADLVSDNIAEQTQDMQSEIGYLKECL